MAFILDRIGTVLGTSLVDSSVPSPAKREMMLDGVSLQELHGAFDIKNFEATSFTRTLVQGDPAKGDFEMKSPTLFSARGYNFHIVVGWLTKKDGKNLVPDEKSLLGLKFHVSSETEDFQKCCGKFSLKLVNIDPEKSIEKQLVSIRKLSPAWMWWPGKDNAVSGFVALSHIFDAKKGFLHDGTLRIEVKLLLAIDDDETARTSTKADFRNDLSKDWGAFFKSAADADVIVKVKNGEIPVHATVLKARSSVLAVALSTPMRENADKKIIIDDLDAVAVKCFIGFLYSGEIDADVLKSDDLVIDVLEAAHRYNVTGLEHFCLQTLGARVDVDNVAKLFYVADLVGTADLRARCLEFIRGHISEVQGTNNYAELMSKRPALAVELLAGLFPPAKRQRREE